MRILLVGDYPADPRLGSSKVAYKLRSEFQSMGHRCLALFEDDLGTKRIPSRLRWLIAPWITARAVLRIVSKEGPFDVIDVASAEGFPLAALGKSKRHGGAAIISRSHGLEHLNYRRMLDDHGEGLLNKPWYRRIFYPAARMSQVGAAARLCDGLILLNGHDRQFAEGRHWKPNHRIRVIPHGVSEAFICEPSDRAERPRNGLLFCGTWTDVKGVAYLARAFNTLVSEGLQLPLCVLGGGVQESVVRSCFSEAASAFLNILPRCSEQQVMEHYRTHEMLVFPSTYEGFGMVLLEAMSQGLPVITTPVGAALSFVKHMESGLVVAPRNPQAIVAAVCLLSKDKELRRRLGHGGRQAIRGRTWRKTAQETIEFYEACSNRPSRS